MLFVLMRDERSSCSFFDFQNLSLQFFRRLLSKSFHVHILPPWTLAGIRNVNKQKSPALPPGVHTLAKTSQPRLEVVEDLRLGDDSSQGAEPVHYNEPAHSVFLHELDCVIQAVIRPYRDDQRRHDLL